MINEGLFGGERLYLKQSNTLGFNIKVVKSLQCNNIANKVNYYEVW